MCTVVVIMEACLQRVRQAQNLINGLLARLSISHGKAAAYEEGRFIEATPNDCVRIKRHNVTNAI